MNLKDESTIRKWYTALISRNAQKVFCIGRNKTGTTSLAKLLWKLGFIVANQKRAERMLDDWGAGKFEKIIKFSKYGGHVFQDVPYSLPETYKVMDESFPNSRFILSVRDSPEVWYDSTIRAFSKQFGNGRKPTKSDLMNSTYVHPGWIWKVIQLTYKTPEHDPFNKETLIKHYIQYNEDVVKYFKNTPEKLLVIKIKEEDAAMKICNFLETKKKISEMPWMNKT